MDETNRIANEPDQISDELIRITAQLMLEMRPNRRGGAPVGLDSCLDRDLGLDSLGRVELLSRIERTFEVKLPEQWNASIFTRELRTRTD